MDYMIYRLQDNLIKLYKRKKLKHIVDEGKGTADTTADMDLAQSDGECASENQAPLPLNAPSALPSHITADEHETTAESPSMIELQRQKEELLKALAESGDTTAEQPSISDALIDSLTALEADLLREGPASPDATNGSNSTPVEEADLLQDSPASPDATNSSSSAAKRGCDTPEMEPAAKKSRLSSSTPIGATKEIVNGTPLLSSTSPYTQLPDGPKWSVGVSDVIDFENLPDATGKYEKLSGLIKRIRSVVGEINAANDAECDD